MKKFIRVGNVSLEFRDVVCILPTYNFAVNFMQIITGIIFCRVSNTDRNRYELFKIGTMLPIPLRCSVKAKMTDNFEKKTIERNEEKNNGIRKRRKEKREVGAI